MTIGRLTAWTYGWIRSGSNQECSNQEMLQAIRLGTALVPGGTE